MCGGWGAGSWHDPWQCGRMHRTTRAAQRSDILALVTSSPTVDSQYGKRLGERGALTVQEQTYFDELLNFESQRSARHRRRCNWQCQLPVPT